MRFIIAGGTGLIGSYLSESLVKEGHEIIILTRSTRNRDSRANIKYESWDGKSAKGWGKLVNGANAIINLTGENISAGRWSEDKKKRILESRQNSGKAIVEAVQAAENKPNTIIQSSGVGYYGLHKDEILDETSQPGNDFLSKVCIEWEKSTKAVTDLGVRHSIIRLGVVLSPKGGALPKMLLPFKFFMGGPIGSGNQWISWIHPKDVVDSIKFIINNPHASGIFNLTAPGALTNREFSKVIGSVLHRPSYLPIPSFVMKIIFGEMSTILLDGQRAVPQNLLNLGFQFQYPDAKSTLNALLKQS